MRKRIQTFWNLCYLQRESQSLCALTLYLNVLRTLTRVRAVTRIFRVTPQHRFRPVGCREGFLSKEVSVAPWLHLFRCGKALEVFWVFGEFLDKIGLTGLPNRSDRFPLPA
jgi:hypothetical protein